MREMHPTNEQLVDYLHGELPARADAVVHEHLTACRPCSQARESEARLTEILRAHARAEEREFPEALKRSIREAIERERAPSSAHWLTSLFRPIVAVPVALAATLVLYVGVNMSHGVTRPARIDAAYYVEDHAALDATTPFAQERALPAMLTSDAVAADQRPIDATH